MLTLDRPHHGSSKHSRISLEASSGKGMRMQRVEHCLAAWEAVCKPTIYGGLGLQNLKLINMALRSRWCWLARTACYHPSSELDVACVSRQTEDPFGTHILERKLVKRGNNSHLHVLMDTSLGRLRDSQGTFFRCSSVGIQCVSRGGNCNATVVALTE
jgi:hypothetical protein